MKIAIITIQNANNYGAIFQAYALQTILSEKGTVDIVNYENKHISRSFDLIRLKPTIHGLLGTGKDIFRILPRYRVIGKFKNFIASNLHLTEETSKTEILDKDWSSYDVFVAGSDQIWNPDCISDKSVLDDAYFLDFAPLGSKKISYASSMGAYKFSDHELEKVAELLNDFTAISVREKERQEMLSQKLQRNVYHVLDPSLLMPKESYLNLIKENSFEVPVEKYILLYTVPKVPLIQKAVKYFSKKTGLKVISIEQGLSAGAKVDKQYRDAGPLEFIKLFKEAEFVITDSFHGVCFSVNFEKPFVAISPGKNVNRMKSLLEPIGLINRIVEKEDSLEKLDCHIDYEEPTKALNRLKERSKKFLFDSLQNNNS